MKRIFLAAALTIALTPIVFTAPAVATNPTSAPKQQRQNLTESQLFAKFAKNYVVYFFYDTDCPHCRAFAPILKDFVTKYNIKVIPITNDGNGFPEFPNTIMNTSQANLFNVEGAPMTFAMNKTTHKRYLIADGSISAGELKANVLRVAKR